MPYEGNETRTISKEVNKMEKLFPKIRSFALIFFQACFFHKFHTLKSHKLFYSGTGEQELRRAGAYCISVPLKF